jgi:hypothetical protein
MVDFLEPLAPRGQHPVHNDAGQRLRRAGGHAPNLRLANSVSVSLNDLYRGFDRLPSESSRQCNVVHEERAGQRELIGEGLEIVVKRNEHQIRERGTRRRALREPSLKRG